MGLGIAVALLVAGLGTGTALASNDAAGISPGDYVRFNLHAFNENNGLVFTTDEGLAQSAREGGNPHMQWLFDNHQLGAREGVYEVPEYLSGDPDKLSLDRFFPSRYLAGMEAGDVVPTPFYLHPFGKVPTVELPSRIGPVPLTVEVNLDSAYDAENATFSERAFGPKETLVHGATIAYVGILEATVEQVDESTVRLHVLGADKAVIDSEVFGLPIKIHDDGDEAWLEPVVIEGQQFITQGCNIPGSIIPPGNYTVVSATEGGFRLSRDLGASSHLMNQPLRFEIEILEVEKSNAWSSAFSNLVSRF